MQSPPYRREPPQSFSGLDVCARSASVCVRDRAIELPAFVCVEESNHDAGA